MKKWNVAILAITVLILFTAVSCQQVPETQPQEQGHTEPAAGGPPKPVDSGVAKDAIKPGAPIKGNVKVAVLTTDRDTQPLNTAIMEFARDRKNMKFEVVKTERDKDKQVAKLKDVLKNKKPDAVVVIPMDSYVGELCTKAANEAKVPIFLTGTPPGQNGEVVSTLFFDNAKGGEKAAETAKKLMKGKGSVLILTPENHSDRARAAYAFKEAIEKIKGMKVAALVEVEGAKYNTAKDTEKALNKYSKVDMIFASSEGITTEVKNIVKKKKMKVGIIGFGASPDILQQINKGGNFRGTIVFHYDSLLRETFEALETFIVKGKEVSRIIKVAPKVINPDNVKSSLAPVPKKGVISGVDKNGKSGNGPDNKKPEVKGPQRKEQPGKSNPTSNSKAPSEAKKGSGNQDSDPDDKEPIENDGNDNGENKSPDGKGKTEENKPVEK